MTKTKFKNMTKAFFDYTLIRLNESATWRGIVLMLAAIGSGIEPDKAELFIVWGLFFSGAIGAVMGQRLRKNSRSTDRQQNEQLL